MESKSKLRTAYISLGGNIGDTYKSFISAIDRVQNRIGPISGASPVYRTKALNPPDNPDMQQDDYLNAVISCQTELEPREILEKLLLIEQTLGRLRDPSRRWGPRVIDLDLLMVDDLVVNTPELTLPHPEMHKRDFVLNPLSDIAPQCMHPILKRTTAELIHDLEDRSDTPFVLEKLSLLLLDFS